jgi:heat-inducible transcriptional repressor
MDQKEVLGDIFSEGEDKLAVSIGKENEREVIKDLSIIRATYSAGDKSIGRIGIIGPRRMNYARAIGVLNCMVEALNEVLNKAKQFL